MNYADKRRIVQRLAESAGFDACGVAPARRVDREAYYRRWLARGAHGEMHYLDRYRAQRTDASVLLAGARSVIVVALSYHRPDKPEASPVPDARAGIRRPRGRIAMYAGGDDYHRVMKSKLFSLVERMRDAIDEPFEAKVCVDTAPIIERDYAMLAGLGWIGKNTLVLTPKLGSYFFLGEIVTTLAIEIDSLAVDHCGSCTRCLEACPTDAFPAPYQMDASRCISYLTIEHRGDDVDPKLAGGMGDWIFGCDVCQQVCPFNQDAPPTREPRFADRITNDWPDLETLAVADDSEIRKLTRGSAMERAKPGMLRRNARIALVNRDG